MLTRVKRRRTTFQDVLCEGTDLCIVERSDSGGRRASVYAVALEGDDELRVAQDGHISIVSAGDDLTSAFKLSELSNHSAVHEVIVEVVLGLINNQWRVGSGK
ncbi:hypothetical protein ASG06_17580 [Rathayibacter sp. Leaf185]|nr:hypothetical protein ASF42_18790 [Rathayibacter sp. Leaf294]KQS08550.1 hypothetical protein ASG06_17580 [Rathayibacter sp. Leaf185]